jgi:probable phosphoglycerate mutase
MPMDMPNAFSHLPSELIDTVNLHIILVSPRRRAHDTFHLLTEHLPQTPNHVFTADVREWDYGDYEGLKAHEIRAKQPTWSIWRDGLVLISFHLSIVPLNESPSCPNGESVEQMTARVDCVIRQVRSPIRYDVRGGIEHSAGS